MDIKEKATDLFDMIGKGQMMEAFEKYYADDVSMQENEKPPMVGKAENRAREQALVDGLLPVDDFFTLNTLTVGDNVTMAEYTIHINHKDWGDMPKKTQIAVQHWKDGKIVKEKFYYAA